MDYGPAVAALIGGVFGALIGKFVDYRLKTQTLVRNRDAKGQVVADALRGEIKAIRDKILTFAAPINNLIGCDNLPLDQAVVKAELEQFQYIPAPVYDAYTPQIGMLWNRLSKEVVEFYAHVGALKRYSQRICISSYNAEVLRRLVKFHRESQSLMAEASTLQERLNIFSKRYYDESFYPDKRNRRKRHLT